MVWGKTYSTNLFYPLSFALAILFFSLSSVFAQPQVQPGVGTEEPGKKEKTEEPGKDGEPDQKSKGPGVEWHGTLRTLYYPRRMLIYHPEKQDLESQLMIPALAYLAEQQENSLIRYYASKEVQKYVQDKEREIRLVHNAYQLFRFSVLNLGSPNASFVLDGRLAQRNDANQPEFVVQRLFYKHVDLFPHVDEIIIGRELAARAAGLTNFDGASAKLGFGAFYFYLYGGLLLDDDYMHKEQDPCLEWPTRTACVFGDDFLPEDYEHKWRASDIRNFSSKERQGDTLVAGSLGMKAKKGAFELDVQKKTDAQAVTEELGGLNFLFRPLNTLELYGNARANLLEGERYSALAGLVYRRERWKFVPEYEYYRPNFKEGSLWENFHTFARSAYRFKTYRYLTRKFRMLAAVGKIYYLDDNSKSDTLTTKTTRDPNTGEVIGDRGEALPQAPLNPSDILGNPNSVDPATGRPASVATRPMTLEELAVHSFIENSYQPKNGYEGQFGIDYFGVAAIRWQFLLSTLQGPEGHVNKISAHAGFPLRAFRVLAGIGRAYYEDIESKTNNETADYISLGLNYRLNLAIRLDAGLELYRDPVSSSDVRGTLGFRYDF